MFIRMIYSTIFTNPGNVSIYKRKKIIKMNQRYLDDADYNIWANNRLIQDLSLLEDEFITKEITSSFPSIRSTVQHIWYAEAGWLSRLNGDGWDVAVINQFDGSNQLLYNNWQQTSEAFRLFVATADLENEIQFEQKGNSFSIPTGEIIKTVFFHGSYHRGQIITMMRQLGINKITQTDYIEWVREKERGNI